MGFSYFKRYRMEHDLRRCLPAPPSLPAGYQFVPWDSPLVDIHGDVKFRSFRWEIDSGVFSCLGEIDGCRQLMREISQRDGFLPSTTWLVQYECPQTGEVDYCGTIQGIQTGRSVGSIQNVGTTPEHRNRGIGKQLIAAAQEQAIQHHQTLLFALTTQASHIFTASGFKEIHPNQLPQKKRANYDFQDSLIYGKHLS